MTDTSATRPWEAPDQFPLKPADGEYGYLRRRTPIPCTLGELQEHVRRGWRSLPLVWTPESARIVPAVEAACLFDVVKQRLLAKMIWSAVRWAVLGVGLAGFILLSAYWDKTPIADVRPIAEMILIFLGGFPAYQSVQNYRVLKTYSVRHMAAYGRVARYQVWLSGRRRVTTWVVAACILVVAACQMRIGFEESIEYAALLKPLPPGQWWRLLTCALMHGNLIHLGVNFFSLLVLGRWLEAHTRSAYLPLVFVVSAIAGSFASLRFGHQTGASVSASVGASGGLLGLIGFLAVMGYRRRAHLPQGFFQTIVLNLVLVGAMGANAPKVIDNAAHFGGMCAGLVIGLMVFNGSAIALRGMTATVAGGAASLLLIAACARTLYAFSHPIIPPPNEIGAGYFDATEHFRALYGKALDGKFQINRATLDATRGPMFDTLRGIFVQPGTYSFKFDELDDAGRVFQSRWIRVRVTPNAQPIPMLVCPDDSMWSQYQQGTIATQPQQPAVVQWTESSPGPGGERWNLAGIQYDSGN